MIKINYALDFALVGSKFVPCKYMYFGCKKVYFGKYYFWTDDTAKRSGFEKFMLKTVNRIIFNLNKLIKKAGIESKSYSAFCGIVAERK